MRTTRSLLLLVFVAVFAAQAHAQSSTQKPMPGVRFEQDIPYVSDGDPAQKLDLYRPEHAADHRLPLVVWVHGGGWMGGSKSGCPAAGFVRRGYIVASVEYRFSQKAVFPAQIQDCQAAIRWLRANAGKYHIDPDHVGVWGASAGGHLVALLGTAGGTNAFPVIGGNEKQSDRVQAVCDFFGPSDFADVMAQAASDKTKSIINFNHPGDPYSQLIGVPLNSDPAKDLAVSPVHYVSKDDPPFLIVHGTVDALVPFAQSVELADTLKKAGVPVILQPMPHSNHGGPAFDLPALHRLINHFFDKYLKGEDVKVERLPDDQVTMQDNH